VLPFTISSLRFNLYLENSLGFSSDAGGAVGQSHQLDAAAGLDP
jgi:hypothetical protein